MNLSHMNFIGFVCMGMLILLSLHVHSSTPIERVWTDDFIYSPGKWMTSTGSTEIFTDGTGKKYHGPYANSQEMSLTRNFECAQLSYLNISFSSVTYKTDITNYLYVAINGIMIGYVPGNINLDTLLALELLDINLLSLGLPLGDLRRGNHGPFIALFMPANTIFQVGFYKRITDSDDFWMWSDIKIICESIPIPPEIQVPTLAPVAIPSVDIPGLPPVDIPLPPINVPLVPTNSPTASPTDTPTIASNSPTKHPTSPTVPPTLDTRDPTFSPTAPSLVPTSSPTNNPSISPVPLPTGSPTMRPTESPIRPTVAPTPTSNDGSASGFNAVSESTYGLSSTATIIILVIIVACVLYIIFMVCKGRNDSSAVPDQPTQPQAVINGQASNVQSPEASIKSSDERAVDDIFVFA